MKPENKIFFSDKEGITSTSAQHLCNVGREYIRSTNIQLSNTRFYNEKVTDLSKGAEVDLKRGLTTIDGIEENLLKVVKINSFIAWMQEAIKAKSAELQAIKELTFHNWLLDQKIDLSYPETLTKVTLNDKIASLSIKDRMKYYHLQAKAAVLGKAIHPDGPIYDARIELMNIASEPNTLTNDKVFSKEASLPAEDVDNLYFKLQKLYREAEASFNAIKGSLEQEVNIENSSNAATFTRLCNELKAQQNVLTAKYEEWKISETRTISKLKIIIPNDLKDTYEFLSNL